MNYRSPENQAIAFKHGNAHYLKEIPQKANELVQYRLSQGDNASQIVYILQCAFDWTSYRAEQFLQEILSQS